MAVSDLEDQEYARRTAQSFRVDHVASATGAGDGSIAGFLAAYLDERSIEDTLNIACAVGAQNVTAFDALSGVRTWDETLGMVSDDRSRNMIISAQNSWKKCGNGLWKGVSDHTTGD